MNLQQRCFNLGLTRGSSILRYQNASCNADCAWCGKNRPSRLFVAFKSVGWQNTAICVVCEPFVGPHLPHLETAKQEAREAMLTQDPAVTKAAVFKACHTPKTVAQLCRLLGLTKPTVQRYLKLLQKEGLVASTPHSSVVPAIWQTVQQQHQGAA